MRKSLSGLALVLTVALAACSDGTGITAENFDPVASAQDVEAVSVSFETEVFRSLDVMGEEFDGAAGAAAALAAEVTHQSWIAATARTGLELREAGSRLVDALSSTGGAAVTIIPESFRGRTYVHFVDQGYAHDVTRTDGPSNGIRFILYAINPVTDAPTDVEIGYVDLLDESTTTSGVIRVIVVSEGTEFVNYTVTATALIGSLAFNIEGFLTDGTTLVNLDLTTAFEATFATADVTVDYAIDVPSENVTASANIVISANLETQEVIVNMDAQFEKNDVRVQVTGEFSDTGEGDLGTIEVSVNGDLFATITLTSTTITVVDANGDPLTEAEAAAVRAIFEGLGEIFGDSFEALFDPVEWLFTTA